jgi:DNA-directed RNA polymerase specialized sigma24 family protein
MPSGESRDGKKIALQESLIREKVVDRFQELLAKDRNAYADKLDFYEVRFDMTLKRLLIAVQRQVWRETKRSRPLENPETGEISAEVEESAGTFDPFNSEEFGGNDYRSRLDAAIDSLTPDQRRIVTMCKMGIPIDSIDPKAVTISKTLKRSEKTIRTERKKAFAAIKKFLQKGDE